MGGDGRGGPGLDARAEGSREGEQRRRQGGPSDLLSSTFILIFVSIEAPRLGAPRKGRADDNLTEQIGHFWAMRLRAH